MVTFGEFAIDASVLWPPNKAYFFSGSKYIRVTLTGEVGPGRLDSGYPRSIYPNWNFPVGFGEDGISAAMEHPFYNDRRIFFSNGRYIEVRVTPGAGTGELITPEPLDDADFYPDKCNIGRPINAAIKWNDNVAYFFRGPEFARMVQREGAWYWETLPLPISLWSHWPRGFGDGGIDDAIRWGDGGTYVYIFSGGEYIRIFATSPTGMDESADPGYPRRIYPNWNFPELT